MDPVRGSSSRRSVGVLLQMQKFLEKGDAVAITPDGPRGPRYHIAPGVLYAAQQTGVPILPLGCGSKRKWTFNSWDRFEVPKPFNRIAAVYGAPIFIGQGDDLTERAAELKSALDVVSSEADRLAMGSDV